MTAKTVSTEEHLVTLIKQIAVEQEFDISDTTIIVVPLSSAEDYPQFKFKIKVTHEAKDDLHLFAKVTELDHNNWDNLILKPFEKERLFYSTLIKTYRKLEDKHGLSEKDRLRLPVCYGVEVAHRREILILEDLASRGFASANRLESVGWPYAAAAITELAKFHALSMAFKHESSTEFEEFTTKLPGGLFEKNEETVSLLKSFKSLALEAVRSENKNKLRAFFKSQDLTSFNDMLKPLNHKVILHAHFWPKNMMHKVLNDGTVEVTPIDYTTIQAGDPVTDVIHFIFTAADTSFRANHYEELIHHYCLELIQATGKLGLDIKQECNSDALEAEMIEKLHYGLLAVVAYLPVLAFDDRADRGMGGEENSHDFAGAQLYQQRLNQVVDEFVGAKILKENLSAPRSKRCVMCFIC